MKKRRSRIKGDYKWQHQKEHSLGESNPSYKHGETDSQYYRIWRRIRQRCKDPNHDSYKYYGGRGIKICKRWDVFLLFKEDMGTWPGKGYSVDRIDNSKGYSPENCRWATAMEQASNRRTNKIIEYEGRRENIANWARIKGLPRKVLETRIRKGWPITKALHLPIRDLKKSYAEWKKMSGLKLRSNQYS